MLGKRRAGFSETPLFKTLDAIYLDTECLLTMNEVPTKVPLFLIHVRLIETIAHSLERRNSGSCLFNISFPA
jgi:hypothetical protein